MHKWKKLNIVLLIVGLILLCCDGCVQKIDNHIENGENSNVNTFNVQNLEIEGQISVQEYSSQYDLEVQELVSMETTGISFQDCEFRPFPEIECVEILACSDRNITAQEAVDVMEDWLEQIGLEDQVDVKTEIRDASAQLPRDEGRDYPYDYPGVYEHFSKLSSGQGFFINTDQCYLQMGNGFMQMSDGKIGRYMGSTGLAAFDAFGGNAEETVAEGSIDNLKGEEYELPGGRMSVQEGAEVTRRYLLAGTPYPYGEGIDVGVSDVRVFRLKDKYGYEFHTYRMFHGVPFATGRPGRINMFEADYQIEEEVNDSYVIDSSGVTAFSGYREAEELTVVETNTRMLGIKEAVNRMKEQLAQNLTIDVEHAGLVYCPIRYGQTEDDKKLAKLCWMFDGRNIMNNWQVRIYVDVVTGELYYYEYQEQEG